MTIELLTQHGEFISFFDIPNFSMSPGVVLWGSRVFSKVPGRREGDPDIGLVYRETLAYTLTARDEGEEAVGGERPA
jgi:hypothetical protein